MNRSRPPGPKDWLFGVGLLRRLQSDSIAAHQWLQREFGDVVGMRLGPVVDTVFFHPAHIHELLVEKSKNFIRATRQIKVLRQWNGDGLLTTEGDTWMRHRRILTPAFSPKRLASYGPAIVQASRECWDRAPRGQAVDFEELTYALTTSIICRTMFGAGLGEAQADLRRAIDVLSGVAVDEMLAPLTLPDWLPLPGKARKRWAMRLLDETVRGFIRDRRSRPAAEWPDDLLGTMLAAVDHEGDGRGLTDEQARDHCVTIFLAGHDTTAAGLTWIGWALASHPGVQERAAAEVREVLGGQEPRFEDAKRLPYLERVIKETLRRWPPAAALLARQAVEDVEVGGYLVPRGGWARVFTYITHHDPRWYPAPERFDPDRWLPDSAAEIPAQAYLPFGAGPRACIGAGLATLEMILATAILLQRVRLAPAAGQAEPRPDPRMSLRPIGGLRLELSPR